jgi:serine/threonine protein kinase
MQYGKKGDIWSFGVMAYKFFLNKLPFEGSNEVEVFRSIIEDEIDLSKVDPEAEELLVLSLKKDPE